MAHTDKDLPERVKALHDPAAAEHHAVGCPNDPLGRATRVLSVPYEAEDERTEWRISPLTGLGYAKRVTVTVTAYRREVRDVARECDIASPQGLCGRWQPYRHHCDPSADDRRNAYYGPERAHVRGMLRAAAREYNAHGDTDVEPEPRQHRHGPWRHGYWD